MGVAIVNNINQEAELGKITRKMFHKGKVRNVYEVDDKLLIVATDRISAFDHVLPTVITDKGKILNRLSIFWFEFLKNEAPNHILISDFNKYPVDLKSVNFLRGRSVIVKKAKRIDIECIVRGYLAGSGWKEYQRSTSVCGIGLPAGLMESSKLPEPIFTPSSKEEGGKHDENITFNTMQSLVGKELANKLKELSIKIYNKASEYAETRGIIIADTKFEFGLVDNQIILIDEVLTPDSSRFWEKNKYQEGRAQDSLDKQFVRDYLESIKWNELPLIPPLPETVVSKTRSKYIEAYEKITGHIF
jgi:phosphoribosylaminoimidazole-succinocarboxamide synthase